MLALRGVRMSRQAVDIERVGDGILCTLSEGGTIFFETLESAASFGAKLILVARYGDDRLDELP